MQIYKFSAEWCGPCRAMTKTLARILTHYPDIEIITVDVDKQPDLASKYRVSSLPVLAVVDHPEKRLQGMAPESQIRGFFDRAMGGSI